MELFIIKHLVKVRNASTTRPSQSKKDGEYCIYIVRLPE